MPRINDKTWRDDRKADAKARAAESAGRSPVAQLMALDGRLGFDVGATKERARLKEQLTDTKLADYLSVGLGLKASSK